METQNETVITTGKVSTDALDIFPGINTSDIVSPVSIFNNDKDMSFVDKPGAVKLNEPAAGAAGAETPEAKAAREKKEAEDKEKGNAGAAAAAGQANQSEADKILNSLNLNEEETDDDEGGKGGADTGAAGDKGAGRGGITSYLKAKIEAGDFQAFEDWDEKKETLDQYLNKQPIKTLHQMLDANWEAKEAALLEQTPKEFFESLPESLQYVARAAMNGATEQQLAHLYGALSRIEQVKAVDISTEEGQIATARQYLQALKFGTPEEIEDEVAAWKNGNRLEKKAKEIKPKLDAMYKERIEYEEQQRENFNKQQRERANQYIGHLNKAFEKNEIGGIKLDKKTAGTIYTGLSTAQYPSISGQPTNLLGHILDKIQFVEPNFDLLAELTYHAMDPEGYRKSIMQLGKNEQVVDTVKKLKGEQQTSGAAGGGTVGADDDEGSGPDGKKKGKLVKPRSILEGWK